MGRATSTSPDKGIPNKRIGVVNLAKNSKGIVNINGGCEMEEPTVKEEEVIGVVGWGDTEC